MKTKIDFIKKHWIPILFGMTLMLNISTSKSYDEFVLNLSFSIFGLLLGYFVFEFILKPKWDSDDLGDFKIPKNYTGAYDNYYTNHYKNQYEAQPMFESKTVTYYRPKKKRKSK